MQLQPAELDLRGLKGTTFLQILPTCSTLIMLHDDLKLDFQGLYNFVLTDT